MTTESHLALKPSPSPTPSSPPMCCILDMQQAEQPHKQYPCQLCWDDKKTGHIFNLSHKVSPHHPQGAIFKKWTAKDWEKFTPSYNISFLDKNKMSWPHATSIWNKSLVHPTLLAHVTASFFHLLRKWQITIPQCIVVSKKKTDSVETLLEDTRHRPQRKPQKL